MPKGGDIAGCDGIPGDALGEALTTLFELSPVAFSISTAGKDSRYVKVNAAFLRLIGRTWEEIAGRPIVGEMAAAPDDPARLQRLHTLDTVGSYEMQEVNLRHASGRIIPTLISAHRRTIGGVGLDIEIIIDNSGRKKIEQALLEAASTDSLTGLPNRMAFDRALQDALARRQPGEVVGLAFIDLNKFKEINDRHGHAVGDELLRIVARRLRASTRPTNFVARLAGDEFAVIFTLPRAVRLDPAWCRRVAARICRCIRIGGKELSVGMAVGIALVDRPVSGDLLLMQADSLMYEAKASGEPVAVRLALDPGDAAATGDRPGG